MVFSAHESQKKSRKIMGIGNTPSFNLQKKLQGFINSLAN